MVNYKGSTFRTKTSEFWKLTWQTLTECPIYQSKQETHHNDIISFLVFLILFFTPINLKHVFVDNATNDLARKTYSKHLYFTWYLCKIFAAFVWLSFHALLIFVEKKYTLMLDFWYVSELALCNNSNGANYSRMDQVKFVKDSL